MGAISKTCWNLERRRYGVPAEEARDGATRVLKAAEKDDTGLVNRPFHRNTSPPSCFSEGKLTRIAQVIQLVR